MQYFKLVLLSASALMLSACEFINKTDTIEDPTLPLELSESYRQSFDKRPEQTAKRFLKAYDKLARSGPVTSSRVLDSIKTFQATKRGAFVSQLLAYDINADGEISRDEWNSLLDASRSRSRHRYSFDLFSADKNKNDTISTQEMIAFYHSETIQKAYNINNGSIEHYLHLFDLDNDGTTTRDEMLESFSEVYKEPETPPSKIKLNTQIQTKKPTRNKRSLSVKPSARTKPQLNSNCDIPAASSSAEIIAIGGYEAKAYTNLALGGQDKTAFTTHITIEKGKKPLYIIATSYHAMLWLIDGDTDRVKAFIAQPAKANDAAGVAVHGLSKDVITFVDKGCFQHSYETPSKNQLILKGQINKALGQEPDLMTGAYSLTHHNLPSGKSLSKDDRQNSHPASWWSHKKFKHDGQSVNTPARKVISPSPVKPYEVLPNKAGLKQLLDQGLIKEVDTRTYHIVKSIPRFPAGLAGGYSVTFILGKGVKMPKGSLGHSKLFSEETGEQLNKR